MSSNTWTPPAVASEARAWRGRLWRAVEAQHTVSTMRLVATLAEQELLERILDDTKPPLPEAARGLHYLLATPFRYPPVSRGSRFRGLNDPGVFYGAGEIRTACAELGYFHAEAEGAAVDLRQAPLVRDAALWTDPADYSATQSFGRIARDAGVALICYQSVRDPQRGGCVAALTPAAFRRKSPLATQAWFLTVTPQLVIWQRERRSHEFDAGAWRSAPQ